MRKITPQILEQAFMLRKEGETYHSIAQDLGVAPSTLFVKLKKLERANTKQTNTKLGKGISVTVRTKIDYYKEKTIKTTLNMENLRDILEIQRLRYDLFRIEENAARDLRDAEKEYQRFKEKYDELKAKSEKKDKEILELEKQSQSLRKQASFLDEIDNYILILIFASLEAKMVEVLAQGMGQSKAIQQPPEQFLQDHLFIQELSSLKQHSDLAKIVSLLAQKPHETIAVLNFLQSKLNI